MFCTQGFQTYLYRTSGFIERVDMAWKLVNLPATIKRQISNVTLCADHKVCELDMYLLLFSVAQLLFDPGTAWMLTNIISVDRMTSG
jgi:hypothetical protein